jgi:DNA-binding transcriptional LysR family regulator
MRSTLRWHRLTTAGPQDRELWLVFHRDVGRSPAVRVVIDRITEVATAARKAFLGERR